MHDRELAAPRSSIGPRANMQRIGTLQPPGRLAALAYGVAPFAVAHLSFPALDAKSAEKRPILGYRSQVDCVSGIDACREGIVNGILSMTRDQYLKRVFAIRPSLMKAWIWSVTQDFRHLEELRQEACARLLDINDVTVQNVVSVTAHAREVCRSVGAHWVESGGVPAQTTAHPNADRRLERAMAALTPRQRSALLMREKHGFTTAEIAYRLGIKEDTVKKHLREARKARAEFLSDQFTDVWLRALETDPSMQALWGCFEAMFKKARKGRAPSID